MAAVSTRHIEPLLQGTLGPLGIAEERDFVLHASPIVGFAINLYSGSPTSGGTDGVQLSTAAPLAFTVPGVGSESAAVKCSVRAVATHSRTGAFPIQIRGGVQAMQFALAADSSGSPGTWMPWGGTLILPGPITDSNTIFWAKARYTTDDDATAPDIDKSIILRIPINLTS